MSGFAPSAKAAALALGSKNNIQHAIHPGGAKGVKFSLEEVARRVKDGRNDPRIKAWAGQILVKAGKPQGVRAQMQAILDAFRKQTMYVPDPVQTEMIASPHVTLCLDEHGLCMPASDCDDRVVAVASAAMSIGIEARVVGQAFQGEQDASHVILEVNGLGGAGWLPIDPSSDTWPVGHSAPCTKEWRVDPMGDGAVPEMGDQAGDFVGIGRLPVGLAQEPVNYILGQQVVPTTAPVGSTVSEPSGSTYTTRCTKQSDGSWLCTNGSRFSPGELENRAWTVCAAGDTYVAPGLCIPPAGLKLSSGATIMPDGSYHFPDGSIFFADGSYQDANGTKVAANGEVTLSTSTQIGDALAAAEQAVLNPLQTTAVGANAIAKGAGTVVSSTISGFGQGVPPVSGGWVFAIIAASVLGSAYLLAPIAEELLENRRVEPLQQRRRRG